jgi:clan AA aspartic protease (TIGR02281 family)
MRCRASLPALLICVLASPIALRAAEVQLGTTGGVYTVPVQINRSITLQLLVDPGAAMVVLPIAVFNRLAQNGTIAQGDFLGIGTAELADSSVYQSVEVRLRELKVGDIVLRDVTAAVAPGLKQPLLGQSFLSRFRSVTFDNQRRVLILSGPSAAPQLAVPRAALPYLSSQTAVLPHTAGYGSVVDGPVSGTYGSR